MEERNMEIVITLKEADIRAIEDKIFRNVKDKDDCCEAIFELIYNQE